VNPELQRRKEILRLEGKVIQWAEELADQLAQEKTSEDLKGRVGNIVNVATTSSPARVVNFIRYQMSKEKALWNFGEALVTKITGEDEQGLKGLASKVSKVSGDFTTAWGELIALMLGYLYRQYRFRLAERKG